MLPTTLWPCPAANLRRPNKRRPRPGRKSPRKRPKRMRTKTNCPKLTRTQSNLCDKGNEDDYDTYHYFAFVVLPHDLCVHTITSLSLCTIISLWHNFLCLAAQLSRQTLPPILKRNPYRFAKIIVFVRIFLHTTNQSWSLAQLCNHILFC